MGTKAEKAERKLSHDDTMILEKIINLAIFPPKSHLDRTPKEYDLVH
jgi:hypothetical protein